MKMLSIAPGENVEARHFMDEEHQITIGIARHQWPRLQRLANQAAEANGGRPDPGAEWDRLNGWILRRLSSCPRCGPACMGGPGRGCAARGPRITPARGLTGATPRP